MWGKWTSHRVQFLSSHLRIFGAWLPYILPFLSHPSYAFELRLGGEVLVGFIVWLRVLEFETKFLMLLTGRKLKWYLMLVYLVHFSSRCFPSCQVICLCCAVCSLPDVCMRETKFDVWCWVEELCPNLCYVFKCSPGRWTSVASENFDQAAWIFV